MGADFNSPNDVLDQFRDQFGPNYENAKTFIDSISNLPYLVPLRWKALVRYSTYEEGGEDLIKANDISDIKNKASEGEALSQDEKAALLAHEQDVVGDALYLTDEIFARLDIRDKDKEIDPEVIKALTLLTDQYMKADAFIKLMTANHSYSPTQAKALLYLTNLGSVKLSGPVRYRDLEQYSKATNAMSRAFINTQILPDMEEWNKLKS